METQEKTHPWHAFTESLQQAPARLLLMLGECQSRCLEVAGCPVPPETAQSFEQFHLVRGALAAATLDGSMLTEAEALAHVSGERLLPPSREYLGREIENILREGERIVGEIDSPDVPVFTAGAIADLNLAVLSGLEVEQGTIPGVLRTQSSAMNPDMDEEIVPKASLALLERLCTWLNSRNFGLPENLADTPIPAAIVKAAIAHLCLVWIQPFGEGNMRTAALLEFQTLVRAGIPPICGFLPSIHYNLTRSAYYRKLDQASRSGGDVHPFLEYAVRGILDGLREQAGDLRAHQCEVTWRDHVQRAIPYGVSTSRRRQRCLVEDLSIGDGPIPVGSVGEVSPRTAKAYAKCSQKTLSRDLKALCEAGLLVKTPEGDYRAAKEAILPFSEGLSGQNSPLS